MVVMWHDVQAGHVCGDSVDLIDGKPTGSVRISFGFSSTLDDAQQFLQFVYECFLDNIEGTQSSETDSMSTNITDSMSENACDGHCQFLADEMKSAAAADDDASKDTASRPLSDAVQLLSMFIYPVKSCAAVQVNNHVSSPALSLSH